MFWKFSSPPETTLNNTCNSTVANSTGKLRDVTTKPTKLEQKKKFPTIQILPGKNGKEIVIKILSKKKYFKFLFQPT